MASRDSASGAGRGLERGGDRHAARAGQGAVQTPAHEKTLTFVSTDGGSDGALGARQFASDFPQRDLIDGADRPVAAGLGEPAPALAARDIGRAAERLLRVGADRRARILVDQTGDAAAGRRGSSASWPGWRFRAAWATRRPVIERGIDAIGLVVGRGAAAAGAGRTRLANLSAATLGDFGRTALLLTVTLDAAPGPPDHGPIRLRDPVGKPRPRLGARAARADAHPCRPRSRRSTGWAGPSGAGGGSAGRWGGRLPRACLRWRRCCSSTSSPRLGIVAQPTFPVRPRPLPDRRGRDRRDDVARADRARRLLRDPGDGVSPLGWGGTRRRRRSGLISVGAVLLAWLANPFLALLLVPIAHVWLLDARRERSLPWPAVARGGRSPCSRWPRRRRRRGSARARIGRAVAAPAHGRGRPDRIRHDARALRAGRAAWSGSIAVAARRGGTTRRSGRPAGREPGARWRPGRFPLPTAIWTHLLSRPPGR